VRQVRLPGEVAAKDAQLTLGVADNGIAHNGFLFRVPIIAAVIIILPQLSKTHKRACSRLLRARSSDDAKANA
jgi:hypothetical protein